MAQFYLNGYHPGDPFIEKPHPSVAGRAADLPEKADVVIVGCGPAGLVLAAQLANFPEINAVIIDRKDGPLQVGQADGVACRTVEMFEAFGLADRLLHEGYQVNEVTFWQPDPADRTVITRTGRIRDVEEGLSEMPHVIVNQARMLDYLLDHMKRSARRSEPFYGLQAQDILIDRAGSSDYPVTLTLQHVQDGQQTGATSMIQAKYVVGCDGSRSAVRQAIGRELVGDRTNQSWGVMDVLAVTDFPDVRLKCAIQSANGGNVLLIPREGGYLARFYIKLDPIRDRQMLAERSTTPEKLTEIANRILHPYTLDVKHVGWWSVYEVGQRLCDKFDEVPANDTTTRLPRVFIAGDACHTHSAAAGQGMNVSMQDAWNLGWKLAAVLSGTAKPELLHTYSSERQEIAQELIDFDRKFAGMLAADPETSDGQGADQGDFQEYFAEQGRFTAGVATRYTQTMITAESDHQDLAKGFDIGMRFHSAPVTRLADALHLQLGHAARADGAWRIYIFGDRSDPTRADSAVGRLCQFLASDDSPLRRFTPASAEPDSVIDVRAIFQQGHRELTVEAMPSVLLPRKGDFGLVDYEKMFCPDPSTDDVFDLRGVNRDTGAIVVVRPDQYIAHVLPLGAYEALSDFFAGVLIASGDASPMPVGS